MAKWYEQDALVSAPVADAIDDQTDRMRDASYYAQQFGFEPGEAFDLAPQLNKVAFGQDKLAAEPGKMFADAFKQSLVEKPAMVLRGLTAYTPGKAMGLDPILDKASTYLESLKDPQVEARLAQAKEGKLWPVGEEKKWWQVEAKYLPEVINTWAANVGDQVPIMLTTLAGRMAGKAIGKPVGATVAAGAALVTGGPDPFDVATAPAVAGVVSAVTQHLGGAAPLVAMEAGNFLDAASDLEIDPDISEKYAKLYGLGSGAIEYAQWLWVLGRYSKISKRAQEGVVRTVLKHIGGSAFEGLEEISQGGLQNWLLRKAVAEMKERNPDYQGQAPEIFENWKREGAIGAGVAAITGLPGTGLTIAEGARARRAKVKPETKKFLGEPSVQEIERAQEATGPASESTTETQATAGTPGGTMEVQDEVTPAVPESGPSVAAETPQTVAAEAAEAAAQGAEGTLTEISVPEATRRAKQPKSMADQILESIEYAQAEEAGQEMLDTMEAKGVSPQDVHEHFWKNVYPNIPPDAQQVFERYLRKMTGLKPGDVLWTNSKTGEVGRANSWRDIAENVPDIVDRAELLEGTSRGLVVLEAAANHSYAEAQKQGAMPGNAPRTQLPAAEGGAVKQGGKTAQAQPVSEVTTLPPTAVKPADIATGLQPIATESREVAKSATGQGEAATPAETVQASPAIGGPSGGMSWVAVTREAMRKSKEIRPKIELEQSAERSKRAGAYEGTLRWLTGEKGVPAEEALQRAKGQFTGPLTDYQRYEGIRNLVTPGTLENAFDDIATTDRLRPYDRANVADAFTKLIDGYVLAPWEADILVKWRPELADIVEPRTDKSSAYRMVTSLWRAGLLTGIKTSGLNMLSNLSHAVSEFGKNVPAVGFDIVAKQFTGERTLALTAQGFLKGGKEGFDKGMEYLKTGFSERDVGIKYDHRKVNFGTSKVARALQMYQEFIFRLVGAEDQPFYYGALVQSLYNQAVAQGMNKGFKGAGLQTFADELVGKPTDDMLITAKEDAETAVFTNETALGDIAAAIQRSGGEFVVPFSRTPSAIAMQILNYTPVGVAKEAIQEIRKGQFDQRKMAQAFGRTVFGTGALAAGGALLAAGIMTLGYPDNERERNQWNAEGKKENSIKIGNKWRSVYVLGPLGNVLLVGGYIWKGWKETGSVSKAVSAGLGGIGRSLLDQTFLQSLNQLLAAISQPERSWESFFSSLAGSLVPTIVADIARATDTTERRTGGPLKRIKSRIPGLRETLEPRVDVFGNDVPRYGGNPLEVMLDPTRPVKVRQDVVVDELRRLWDKDVKVTPTMLGDKAGYEALSEHENTVLWRRAGELTYAAVLKLMGGNRYKHLSDEARGKEIEKVVKRAKDWARAEAAVVRMEAGATLTELKEGKLVTEDVRALITPVKNIAKTKAK